MRRCSLPPARGGACPRTSCTGRGMDGASRGRIEVLASTETKEMFGDMQRVQPLPSLEPHSDCPGELDANPSLPDVRLLDSYRLGLLELLLAIPVRRFGYHERLVVLVHGISLLGKVFSPYKTKARRR